MTKDLKEDPSASEVLTEWQDTGIYYFNFFNNFIDILLTDALNESSDNVKFLSNLENKE